MKDLWWRRRCEECTAHMLGEPHLVGAFASVGIEYQKSTYQMAKEYFDYYHEKHGKEKS